MRTLFRLVPVSMAGVALAFLAVVCNEPVEYSVDSAGQAQPQVSVFPGESWKKRDPRTLGMDLDRLADFREAVGPRSYGCVVKSGYVVERWSTWFPPIIANWRGWGSATKPFVATLALFGVQEGRISGLDERVADFGWPLRARDRSMTLRHLLDMTSGYTLPESPGKRYAYNDYGVKLLFLTLVERLYGIKGNNRSSVEDLLTSPGRLGPLQFEDPPQFSIFSVRKGVPRLNMAACDYARFGLLMLNDGRWREDQLIRTDLVDRFLHPSVPLDMQRTSGGDPDDYLNIGTAGGGNNATPLGPGVYGAFWWFNVGRRLWPDVPEDAFQANGHWNRHSLTVIPSLELVVAWRESEALASEPGSFHVEMNRALKHLVEAVE